MSAMRTVSVTTRISGGVHRGRVIRTPKSVNLRPTTERVRAAVFSIIGADNIAEKRVVDLFAGTGAFGMDALSRGASRVDFIEHSPVLCRAIRALLNELAPDAETKVHQGKVHHTLQNLKGQYDLVFADPPYDSKEMDRVLNDLIRCRTVADGGIVVLEYRADNGSIDAVAGFRRLTDRRYGSAAITILETGDAHA